MGGCSVPSALPWPSGAPFRGGPTTGLVLRCLGAVAPARALSPAPWLVDLTRELTATFGGAYAVTAVARPGYGVADRRKR
jgi:hypothetical protein